MNPLTRRAFVHSAAAAGAAMLLPAVRVRGANDDIRVALIGMGGKGKSSVHMFESQPGVRVTALCDADKAHVDEEAAKFAQKYGRDVAVFTDCRKVIESKEVDAIYCAAPNHWHALITIWACQAGKDIYIEKPISHNIWEGRRMIEAQQKYQRIVQAGFQNRSDVGLRPLMQYLHEGNLGKIKLVRGLCCRKRDTIGGPLASPLTPPASCDYDHWLGPAEDAPLLRPRLHYDWHWSFNTGNGDIGNQGPHELDLMRWALGDPKPPRSVLSLGGRFAWNDAGETPNMQIALYDFDGTPGVFELRDLPVSSQRRADPSFRGVNIGIIVECEGGEFRGGRGGGWIYNNKGEQVKQFKGDSGGAHAANFIAAVRSRKQESLRSPIDKAHQSTLLAHLANTSYRLGRPTDGYRITALLGDDDLALGAVGRIALQLADNDVNLAQTPLQMGPKLEFDGSSERYVGGQKVEQANAMLRRQQIREPYIVPEQV